MRNRGEIDTLVRILDAIAQEQAKITKPVNADAYRRDGVDMKLLMTLPGVGAATAQDMMAAIGDIKRFESPIH